MMQPTFLPWIGYFELILNSDVFVILDDFQFVHRSYHQKNRLLVSLNVTDWYTVPVNKKGSFKEKINKVKIKENNLWREKIWKRLENNYSKTSYYKTIESDIKGIILTPTDNLLEQNMRFINYVLDLLKIKTDIIFSSDIYKTGERSGLILNILRSLKADEYLCANGSFEYMLEDKIFPVEDVKVLFQNHVPIEYKQIRTTKFIPYLSILDALFNVGPDGVKEIINGTKKWLEWEDMHKYYLKEGE